MNHAEILRFVEQEIAARYRGGMDDAVRSDWARAVGRAGSLDDARGIIQQIVDSPDMSLNVKSFYRVWYKRRGRESTPIPTGYEAWVRCVESPPEHPEWEDKEWFVLEGFTPSNRSDKRYVTEYARTKAQDYTEQEGGRWTGIVKEMDNEPYRGELTVVQRREAAEAHILAGPGSPGRRHLLARDEKKSPVAAMADALKIQPKEPPPITTANREMLERLKENMEPICTGPIRFDPDNDPDLQDEYSHRDPNNPDEW